jgi:hypothetical protein
MKTKFTTLFVLLFVAVLAAACGRPAPAASSGPATSALTEEQAIAMATNALVNGYNNDDRDAYVADMDDSMKAAITREGLSEFFKPVREQYGNFVSVESAELGHAKTEGYVRWTFTCNFEKGTLYFALVFPTDGTKATGAFLGADKP